MAVIKELIRKDENETLSFGDYSLAAKTKKSDFEFGGDLYKVKTFKEMTKLEKNGLFLYESVPGTSVFDFAESEGETSFTVEGDQDAQITIGLEDDSEYEVFVGGESAGKMSTNLSGKLNISVELEGIGAVQVKLVKC